MNSLFTRAGACLFVCLLSSWCIAHAAEEQVVVPPGVTYKKADDAVNEKVRADLARRFAAGEKEVAGLFSDACVCGPRFWRSFKDKPEAKFKHTIQTKIHVPNTTTGENQVFEGGAYKEPEDLALVAKFLAQEAGTKPVIRKMNTDELKIFWAMISFDIEEPIFVAENQGMTYVLAMEKDEKTGAYTIFWIDELSGYSFTKPKQEMKVEKFGE